MSLRFEIEVRRSYLHVFCGGEFELEAVEEMFRAMFDAASEHDVLRVFVDARSLGGNPSAAERHGVSVFISEEMLERTRLRGIRIGFVGKEPVTGPNRFVETVAKNRGCTVRAGTDMKGILDWLEIGPGDRPDADNDE